ncbi:MAG: AgmX/PglI C-terminal domain-containing protein [Polyangiales bacterium]
MKSIQALVISVAVLGLATEADAQARRRSTVVPGELRLSGGRRTPEAVRFLLERNHARVHVCYDTALRTNATLAGTQIVRFVIEPDGVVSSATAGERTMSDPTMVSCVLQTFSALRFVPTPNASTTVTYTLRFVPVLAR